MTTYHSTFYRPRQIWDNAWAECGDLRVSYRLGTEPGFAKLAAAMINAGLPEGSIQFIEVGTRQPLMIDELPSLLALAATYELAETEAPQRVSRVRNESGLSEALYLTLVGLRDATTTWDDLHHLTRKALESYVADGQVTQDGLDVMAAYETVAAQTEDKPVRKPSVQISPKQREAFHFILDDNFKGWTSVNGKTKNIMVTLGWVVIGERNKPSLTDLGFEVATAMLDADKIAA